MKQWVVNRKCRKYKCSQSSATQNRVRPLCFWIFYAAAMSSRRDGIRNHNNVSWQNQLLGRCKSINKTFRKRQKNGHIVQNVFIRSMFYLYNYPKIFRSCNVIFPPLQRNCSKFISNSISLSVWADFVQMSWLSLKSWIEMSNQTFCSEKKSFLKWKNANCCAFFENHQGTTNSANTGSILNQSWTAVW